jgi:hypothetical protein
MVNIYLELERLRATLRSRGLEDSAVDSIAAKAETEITLALRDRLDVAMDVAVQSGVQKESADFINDLRPRPDAFTIETASGITDFSEPPLPMLDKLLAKGAKPMKDGSGVYKVIPVGGESKQPKKPVFTNIFDAQKAISAERYESAVTQYNKVIPKGSKVSFRTATSKQNRQTQWVLPEKKKDFTEDLAEINNMLSADYDNVVLDIIRNYEEGF